MQAAQVAFIPLLKLWKRAMSQTFVAIPLGVDSAQMRESAFTVLEAKALQLKPLRA